MGGIHHHRGRLGDLLHHALAGHIPLQPAEASLDLRVAVGVFQLFPDLLFAHAQLLAPAAALAEQVEEPEDQEDPGTFPQQRENHGAGLPRACGGGLEGQGQKTVQAVPHHHPDCEAENGQQQGGLEDGMHVLARQILQARER